MTGRPSFEEVFDEGVPYVWHVLRRLGVTENDREDRAQEVFLAVFQSLPTYDPSRPLRPWLHGIAFHVVSSQRKPARNRQEVIMDEVAEPIDPSLDPEQATAAASEHGLLIQLMQTLDLDHRGVVSMHIDGIEMADIARELGIQEVTGYKRLDTARRKLRAAAARVRERERRVTGAAAVLAVPFDLEALFAADRGIPEVASEVRDRLWSRLQDLLAPGAAPGVPADGGASAAAAGSALPLAVRLAGGVVAWAAPKVALVALGAVAGAAGMYAYLTHPTPLPEPPAPVVVAQHVPAAALSAAAGSTVAATTATASSEAAAPGPVITASAAPARASGQEDEDTLIQRARMAYARDNTAGALEALNLHARRYPHGQLAGDREALRAQVLEHQRITGASSAPAHGQPAPAATTSATSRRMFGSDD